MDPNQPVPYGSFNPLNWIPPARDLGLLAHVATGTPYSFLPAMDREEKARYDRYFAAVQGAAKKAPGERMVTASVQNFLEKRAALQGTPMEKQAISATALLGAGGKPSVWSTLLRGAGKAIGPTTLIGGTLLSLDLLGKPLLERIGYKARAEAYPGVTGLPERVRMDEIAAESFAKQVGAEVGKSSVGLLGDLLSKAVSAPAAIMAKKERQSVFDILQKEDDVIARADPQQLAEAYHTMARFAPTLATDKNAVKTFLRESVLYGTGPNPTGIKQLAEAERAVTNVTKPATAGDRR
jgi:hypothetical protein